VAADKPKIVLKLEGVPNSRALATYKADGGYSAAAKALKMTPEAVIEEVKGSGLRGRGGAGFPTGLKWSFVPKNMPGPKYLICNNDESEPGTFKDRHICTVSPHSVIEGMIIAAFAIGANKGYIYTRWEFQEEIGYVEQAIKEAYEAGLLGKNLFGTDFTFDLDHYTGAGAYICGEETGLISSLEGKKGQPKLKPPFPAVSGYLERPTIVNNTETLATVPWIINNGGKAYRQWGTEKSPGTKVFSISGPLHKPGVYEVPLGYSFEKFINEEAGGLLPGRKLKAIIPGGASSPLLTPAELAGLTMDFEALAAKGSMLGSGAIMIIDDQQSMVELLKITIDFFAHESCGQCTPCREGTGWLANIMTGVNERSAALGNVQMMHTIAKQMIGRTICALADACAMPVTSYVEKFGDELRDYIAAGGKGPQAKGHHA
jgi:NADH-quinone oxidoreductase subunit F